MTVPVDIAATRSWPVPVVRGIIALAVTVLITFTLDHSPQFSLLVFGGFAVVSGAVVAVLSWRTLDDSVVRNAFIIQGLFGVIIGVFALIANASGLGILLILVIIWAAVTGMLELITGLRRRRREPGPSMLSRDWITVGAITAVLAVAFVVMPPDPVTAIGVFGIYTAILGVYLIIGGLSLKWGPARTAAPTDSEVSK